MTSPDLARRLEDARRRYCLTQHHQPVSYASRGKHPRYCLRCRVDVPAIPTVAPDREDHSGAAGST